jgi:acyl-phosphate glycerol 3-phosphate acyltransferase
VNPSFTPPTLVLSLLAIVASYAIGSIPFGYLITRWIKGIDIRTVGSGNLGATNVGRVLGFRFFVIVLLLDMLKGLVPTVAFPWLIGKFAGHAPADLPVLVALAAILGHSFPVYLEFRGGKGVATSLGCVLALDAASCAVAAMAFLGVLVVTRYVSLGSLVGGLAFAVAHFVRAGEPFAREHFAMSVFSILLLLLLVARHRGNLARIWAGTENRVDLRFRKKSSAPPQPSGSVAIWVVAALVVVAVVLAVGATWFIRNAAQIVEVSAGPWKLREIDRALTGQQRVDCVAFASGSSRFIVTCPRYDRAIVYQVTPQNKLQTVKEIDIGGRPPPATSLPGRFLVLIRPPGDERHVHPGWWDVFDLDGKRVSGPHLTGYYPDDLAVTPDGKYLYVISSGRGEGGPKKPLPALEVVALDAAAGPERVAGRLEFDANDDLDRLALAASGRAAAVLLPRTAQTAAIDLAVPESPRLIGRYPVGRSDTPYISSSADGDWIMMPVIAHCSAVGIPGRDNLASGKDGDRFPAARADFLICARQDESVLDVLQIAPRCSLGRLPLRGSFNLGRTRPTGIAYSPEHGLLAVATRSGAIHLVEIKTRGTSVNETNPRLATGKNGPSRQRPFR